MLEVKPLTKGKRASSLYEWYADNEEGRLYLTPSYGRNSAPWPEKKQALLVNSVLNGWDLPKFYLADFTYRVTDLMEERRPYAV